MARPDKLSRFLPICFPNGTKVRRFAKHCPRCRIMVTADTMYGIAALLENRIFVAARACCPVCQKRFSITCVITNNRHVHRVMVPDLIFGLWLRIAVRNLPQPVEHKEWSLEEEYIPSKMGLILNDNQLVTHSDEILGHFDGIQISSWIEYQGLRYCFERAAPPGGINLEAGKVLFNGKLIYQLTADPQQA